MHLLCTNTRTPPHRSTTSSIHGPAQAQTKLMQLPVARGVKQCTGRNETRLLRALRCLPHHRQFSRTSTRLIKQHHLDGLPTSTRSKSLRKNPERHAPRLLHTPAVSFPRTVDRSPVRSVSTPPTYHVPHRHHSYMCLYASLATFSDVGIAALSPALQGCTRTPPMYKDILIPSLRDRTLETYRAETAKVRVTPRISHVHLDPPLRGYGRELSHCRERATHWEKRADRDYIRVLDS